MIKRALLSVYDKEGIVELAKALEAQNIEIISSGGTHKLLEANGVSALKVEDVTNSPEILDGRVKTLHPNIHGALLALRDNEDHMSTLAREGIKTIDLVVCNLYPFEETIKKEGVDLAQALENIDIGGPSMIRSAAKNFISTLVITDKDDYEILISKINEGEIDFDFRKSMAIKAFSHTSYYDMKITNYLNQEILPNRLTLAAEKTQELRYGENPHQKAASYLADDSKTSILNASKIQGKELSYNNINDGDAALRMVMEFQKPAAIAVKHTNPCGGAVAEDITTAYKKAYQADPVSIFGGIVALNRAIDAKLAKELVKTFLELVITPKVCTEAKAILATKKNMRVLEINMENYSEDISVKSILGGYLVQEADNLAISDENWEVVTGQELTADMKSNAQFAWKLIKHVKSNAIVVAKDQVTLGVGCGQVNRIDAAKYALASGGDNCQGALLASDGLLPFDDVVKEAAKYGIKTIIQPGGSIRDKDSIKAAKEHQITMIFTNRRHFKH